jgi:hypothetical protein
MRLHWPAKRWVDEHGGLQVIMSFTRFRHINVVLCLNAHTLNAHARESVVAPRGETRDFMGSSQGWSELYGLALSTAPSPFHCLTMLTRLQNSVMRVSVDAGRAAALERCVAELQAELDASRRTAAHYELQQREFTREIQRLGETEAKVCLVGSGVNREQVERLCRRSAALMCVHCRWLTSACG